jgi:hypothetical protein
MELTHLFDILNVGSFYQTGLQYWQVEDLTAELQKRKIKRVIYLGAKVKHTHIVFSFFCLSYLIR